ncbi:hypothetical protein CEB3_c21310 [Peptococcaceae bacterium CEB3]|nr:hypothetical protein CEB3_c21310 [Peptococcaceae bacterium CEB3]
MFVAFVFVAEESQAHLDKAYETYRVGTEFKTREDARDAAEKYMAELQGLYGEGYRWEICVGSPE